MTEWWEGLRDTWWLSLLLIIATAWLAETLNVRCVMIKGRSRLTFVMVLLAGLVSELACSSVESCGEGLLWVLMAFLLFGTYQDRSAVGGMYMAYLMVGLMSVCDVKVLYVVPILWWITMVWMLSLTVKGWIASLLGLATPYWLWGAWALYMGDGSGLASHFERFVEYGGVCEGILDLHVLPSVAVLVVVLVIGMVHYLRNTFRGSIRNRMQHYSLFVLGIFACVAIVLQPSEMAWGVRLLAYASGASAAHFFNRSRSER